MVEMIEIVGIHALILRQVEVEVEESEMLDEEVAHRKGLGEGGSTGCIWVGRRTGADKMNRILPQRLYC